LTRFVRESLKVPAAVSPSGEDVCFDPERIMFFGHSHGGLSGAIAAAFEPSVQAWLLSGGGGGLAITIMERKDVFDISALVELTLAFADGERLSELHPAM